MSFKETLDQLRQRLPEDVIKSRVTHGNFSSDYIEWHTAANILDDTCPEWQHEIKEVIFNDRFACCRVAITIDGVTREGLGVQVWTNDAEKDLKSAEHDALKRAAVKFGIARELYYKTQSSNGNGSYTAHANSPANRDNPQAPRSFSPTTKPAEGKAASPAELATAKQLGMLKAIVRERGVSMGEVVERAFPGVEEGHLSKKAVSWIIEQFQAKAVA